MEERPEEKSPLLLYLVDGDESVSKNNKRVNFDKGRLHGITSGATAVFAEIPNISPCWLTTVLSSLIFFMMILLIASSISTGNNIRVPRCTHSSAENSDNKTIHLVHQLSNWNDAQLELLDKIKNEYEGFDVHLVLLKPPLLKDNEIPKLSNTEAPQLRNQSETAAIIYTANQTTNKITRTKRVKKNLRKRRKRDHMDRIEPLGIGFGVKSLLDILLHGGINKRSVNDTKLLPDFLNITEFVPTTSASQPKTLLDIITDFHNLSVQNITTEEAFANTPLQKTWYKLNQDLIIFAVRVVHLWQYGGMSFKIDQSDDQKRWDEVDNFSVAPEIALQTLDPDPLQIVPLISPPSNSKLLNFILNGRNTFENLPKEVVTADDEGLHIFTKSPCHVFFGEVLMNLKYARGDETPKMIIRKSLRVFCKHSAVGNNYCKRLIRPPSPVRI